MGLNTHLGQVARLYEVCDPLRGLLAFRQAQLHLQHSVREACDVAAANGGMWVPVPPTENSHSLVSSSRTA